MSPDRHGPKDESKMWADMGRLWCCVTRADLLETFLKMMAEPPLLGTSESHNLNMNPYTMGVEPVTGKRYADFVNENASAWQEAWRNVFGDNTVIRTSDRWDGTVKHLGYQSVNLQWNVIDMMSEIILTDTKFVKSSQERLRGVEVVPDARLTHRQLVHLRLAREIADKWSYQPVSGVHAAIIPPASDRVRTAGMYNRVTEEIYIATDQLEHAGNTVDVVIHELAHHLSGAEDLEKGHSEWMTAVAARVIQLTAAREFDDILKEAVW